MAILSNAPDRPPSAKKKKEEAANRQAAASAKYDMALKLAKKIDTKKNPDSNSRLTPAEVRSSASRVSVLYILV